MFGTYNTIYMEVKLKQYQYRKIKNIIEMFEIWYYRRMLRIISWTERITMELISNK